MRLPLIKDRTAVHQDKRVSATRGGHVRPEHGLPHPPEQFFDLGLAT